MATRLVVAGAIGARITWDISHWDQIDIAPRPHRACGKAASSSPAGSSGRSSSGCRSSAGGTAAPGGSPSTATLRAVASGWPSAGSGATPVGEHFGSTTSFFLGTRYDGGSVRSRRLGDTPLTVGTTFHQTAPVRVPATCSCCSGSWACCCAARSASAVAHGHLLRRLRHQPVPVGLPAGQRRAGPRPHRRPVPDGQHRPGQHLDLQVGRPALAALAPVEPGIAEDDPDAEEPVVEDDAGAEAYARRRTVRGRSFVEGPSVCRRAPGRCWRARRRGRRAPATERGFRSAGGPGQQGRAEGAAHRDPP